ncbi:MAG: hypothetical protein ACRDD6_07325 [Tannerellaceae bacterium]
MKNLNFFVASALATTLFASCSNELAQNEQLDSTPKNVAISLNLPKLSQSKGLGDMTTGSNSKVTLAGTVKVYAKQAQSGALVNTYTLTADDFFAADGSSKTKTLEVNGTATFIEVEGNIDDATKTSDVNSRQGSATSSAVRVTGGSAIVAGSGSANATCIVTVAPEMARVEVFGALKATTNINDLKINGIYLNNVKQNRGDAALVKTTNGTTPDWTNAYTAGGVKSNLFTAFTPAITGIEAVAGKAQADGYNFFPQSGAAAATTKEEALVYHPHIIINVSYMKGGVAVNNQWVNVVALKDASNNYFASFENGKIYQLDLADISDILDVVNPPVTPDPDPDAVSVDVTVSVKAWDIVVAKPEV